tara:strand:- start:2317 stop:2559 length:243 start_codon:yes stop_codon:yes gene_type:complete
MRVIQFINTINIIVDNYSISPQTFDLASKIKSGQINIEELPPIKLVSHMDGSYRLKDGRHRITAFKLLGIKEIKSKFYKI